MAAATPHEVPCPDPSVHEKQHKLSEQASTAALYVTNPERTTASDTRENTSVNPLGSDGRLSSKSAAASLKYARPQDLPSFPSHGNAADSASKAAMLAKDYRMKELWQPEQSAAGSKAALLAHGRGGKVELWEASASSEGHSAATQAMRNKTLSPNVDYGVTTDDRSKALLAATMSHNKGRQRAGSTPAAPLPAYPDSQNSAANALNAATVSHRTSTKAAPDGWDSEANQAARIKNLGNAMSRDMFGEHPPVEIEREEANHQAALRASAVSMAKQIYDTQNRTVMASDPADIAGAQAATARKSTSAQPDIKQQAMQYINLQEAAHKLAAERLAKVDKSLEASRYREYYGYEDKPKTLSSRLSLRSGGDAGGRQRKRASSEGTADQDSDDEEQARRIRSQMSQLNSGLSRVDGRKQQDDRAKLLAAAEKRVSARMHNMDEKVFADTGKVPPALMEEWEEKARQRAQRDREQQLQNPGKTHVGGGKFMDQAEIEAIAAARLKPTLDEINDTAEKRRARDEELRQEKEEQERLKREEKARSKEEKEEQRRAKNEEKAAAKKDKDEEKARKSEDKRLAKEEKRKSREVRRDDFQDASIADNVDEEDEPENHEAAEGVRRHRSALDRLKEKFRKSHAEDAEPGNNATPTSVESSTAGVVTGATLAETEPGPLDSQQAAHAVAHDENEKIPVSAAPATAVKEHEPAVVRVGPDATQEPHLSGTEYDDSKWKPVAVPNTAAVAAAPVVNVEDQDEDAPAQLSALERPPFEQKPSLSGYHNDDTLPVLTDNGKPNLERHISQIPESSDDESDDEDWDKEPVANPRHSLGLGNAQAVAERVALSPVVDQSAHSGVSNSMSTTDPVSANPVTTGAVTTDPVVQLETTDDTKDHSILRQVLNPGGKKYDEQGYGTTARVVADEGHDRLSQDTTTADKSVTSGPAKLKKDFSSAPEPKSRTSVDDKGSKGLRGLFSKLRNKESKGENKYPDFKPVSESRETTKASQKPATVGSTDVTANSNSVSKQVGAAPDHATTLSTADADSGLVERSGTDGMIGDSEHVSGLGGTARAESVSSFRRGEAQPNDPDDVSSSGQDEDDISRGRGGRLVQKLGLGSRKGRGQNRDEARIGREKVRQSSDGTDDEQFEEARDHFDENLAPPPAFAGQAKSESPVRETRFQEQL